jgi:ATP-dependent DNA ligase
MVLPCRRLPDDGVKAWAIVEERGYEGMIAKDPRSTYRSGGTRSWMKVKVRREGVFVVGGIRDVNAFDGVLVGQRVGDALRYRGVVEWGFRAPDVLALLDHARRWSRPVFAIRGPPPRAIGDVGRAAARGGGQLRGDRREAAAGAELAQAHRSMTPLGTTEAA